MHKPFSPSVTIIRTQQAPPPLSIISFVQKRSSLMCLEMDVMVVFLSFLMGRLHAVNWLVASIWEEPERDRVTSVGRRVCVMYLRLPDASALVWPASLDRVTERLILHFLTNSLVAGCQEPPGLLLGGRPFVASPLARYVVSDSTVSHGCAQMVLRKCEIFRRYKHGSECNSGLPLVTVALRLHSCSKLKAARFYAAGSRWAASAWAANEKNLKALNSFGAVMELIKHLFFRMRCVRSLDVAPSAKFWCFAEFPTGECEPRGAGAGS